MKNFIQWLLTVFMLQLCLCVNAEDFAVDGIFYNITNQTDKTVSVTYKGEKYSQYQHEYTKTIVIPETVTYNNATYYVTSIEDYAFAGCSGLKNIIIGNSIISIGKYAFEKCSGLGSITIGTNVTNIESMAFYDCNIKTVINYSQLNFRKSSTAHGSIARHAEKVINAPNGEIINNYAFHTLNGKNYFAGYIGDESDLILPETYRGEDYCIKTSVFSNCSWLTSIIISDGVTSIEDYAFHACSNLSNVIIGKNVKTIGVGAFENCMKLTDITIPEKTTDIGKYAFSYCKNLNKAVIGNNVINLGDYVFYDCKYLYNVTIGNSVTKIGNYAFYGCLYLSGITIPNSVTSIGDYAFRDCSSLKKITLGHNINHIGTFAFENCRLITSVIIGNNVASIGDYAFRDCESLKRITIGSKVNKIGSNTFSGCSKLKLVINLSQLTFEKGSTHNGWVAYHAENVVNEPNAEYVDDYIFYSTGDKNYLATYVGNDTAIILPQNYKGRSYSIGDYAFYEYEELTNISIPQKVESIGFCAFYGCRITDIKIPTSVTNIENCAFGGCNKLVNIFVENENTIYDSRENCNAIIETATNTIISGCKSTIIPNGVTRIADYAFYDIYNLINITIPNSVTSIGVCSFKNCTGLTNLTIPGSINSIDEHAFYGCSNLKSIKSLIPAEKLFTPGLEAFYNINTSTSKCTLYVPYNSIDKYRNTDEWSWFTNITELEYNITYIIDGEVYGCQAIAYGAEIPKIETPIKEGHTFSGWSEIPETMPAEDITIIGSFSVNSYTVTYIIDGEEYKTETIEYGTVIALIDEPIKKGHTFSGWSEIPETMPANDITIEGSFAVNSYIVTYLVDGEEYARYTLEYGTEVPIPEVSSKDGYTFSWMNEIPATMPAHDVTIEGTFTANYYTVTYIVDGEVWATDSLAYGSEIVLRDEPTKEGYTFSGWSEAPETMPAKDIVIHGSYVADTAIEEIYLDLEKNDVYNMKGFRITETDKLTRGIYIINGNKTFVK